ncbi:MAG TPA: hypothetical protein VGO48_11200 [Conexibacter sp.]|jgi:hypothetical protein|nr:hypothetical protein [Conexibacter sp.]
MSLKVPIALCTALAACALALPAASVAKTVPVVVEARPDPNLPDPAETGEQHDPYVVFELHRAVGRRVYRIVTERAPSHRADRPCTADLTTQWQPATDGGDVVFPLEPAASGTYMPFAGVEPCHGRYLMKVHAHPAGVRRWSTVRRFSLSYPSFALATLPLHP